MSLRKHTTYNLIGTVLPLVLSLFTIPVYIGLIGNERFGVLATAWLLLGYFGLFDLGLGRATAQHIAAIGESDPKKRAETFWTALAANSVLGILGGLTIWPVAAYFFNDALFVSDVLRPEVTAAIPWLVLSVPIATSSGVLTGALQGRTQFLELNLISVTNSSLIQLFPLAVAWLHGPDLTWLLPAMIFARALTLVLLYFRCRRHVFHGYRYTVSREQAIGLLKFGGWVTVTSLVSPMMTILDRLVIGALFGAKAVTYYTVPFQLAERTVVLSHALSSALFPRLATSTRAEGKQLATAAIRVLAIVMTPLMVIGIFIIEPFLNWWLTPDFGFQAAPAARILLIGFWINALAAIPYIQLQASGCPDLVAKCHLAELLPYLLLLYVGLHYGGLPGAALAFGLRTLSDGALLSYFAGTLRSTGTILYVPIGVLLASASIATFTETGTLAWWGLSTVFLFISLVWSWRYSLEQVRTHIIIDSPLFDRFLAKNVNRYNK